MQRQARLSSQSQSWREESDCQPSLNAHSANVFYCTFTKHQEYKKVGPQLFLFLLVFGRNICKVHLTTAANIPFDVQGGAPIKRPSSVCLLQHKKVRHSPRGAGVPARWRWGVGGGSVLPGARPCTFWLLRPPSLLFVLLIVCCFSVTTRVQQ